MRGCLLALAALLVCACAYKDVSEATQALEPAFEHDTATLRSQFQHPQGSQVQTVHTARPQGTGTYLLESYVIPGGEGIGPWGEWGEVSPCSRTCGGGVASQKRICLQSGPEEQPKCTGGDTKYFSCQTQGCPEGSGDFRAEQCAEFNDIAIRGFKYNWMPNTKAPNPCELNCIPHGERLYFRQKLQVIDGTRCNDDSFDVCVNGTCQPVGCDMMLNSNAREDKCRECRGNGANCRTTEGIYDSQDLVKGYNDLLLIPAGSTSIYIEELEPSNNYLALRNKNGTYYLNGHYHIDFPGILMIAGAPWIYERRQQGHEAPDKLRCLGPTNEPLYLSLLLQDVNVGIRYEYSVPNNTAPPTDKRYIWVHEEFTPCSATCGGGFKTRNVTCRSMEELEVVEDNLCDEGLRPPNNQSCSPDPCPAQWAEGPWRECSQRCGIGGVRSREVTCQKIIDNDIKSVPDKECFDLLGPKPGAFQHCNEEVPCPKWFIGHWIECDRICDEGKQTRQVVCYQKKDGRIEVLDEKDCTEKKPEVEQPCMLQPCEGVDWVTSGWSGPVGCDMMLNSNAREDKCRECRGNGANCRTTEGIYDSQDLVKGYNDLLLIPAGSTSIYIEELEPSNNYLALRNKNGTYYLNGHYHIDFPGTLMIAGAPWIYERSQLGHEAPDKLRCLGPTNEPLYLSLLLQDVNVGIRYEYSVPNNTAPPTDKRYIWVHEEFTPCSATCGGGFKTRNVTCRSMEELEVVEDNLCDEGLRPPNNQSCSPDPCPAQWAEGPWRECSQRCGIGGVRSREVTCQKIIDNDIKSVSDKECFDLLGPKPGAFQHCNEEVPCPKWFIGHWKECDRICDEGKQTRQVVCYQKKDGRIEVLDEKDCTEKKPEVEQPCMLQPCEGVDWVTSGWSGPVGCDMMLNSNAREDKCRECRGNGANCRTTEGIYDSQDLVKGYNDLLLIPAGSTSIYIEELEPSNNYLALRNKNGTYYLNGHYHIDFPGTLMIAGAPWIYERRRLGREAPDKLRCLGPTNEPLYLSLLLQDVNVGIRYEYSVPNNTAPPTDKRYIWVHEEFTPCSATCGGGFKTRNVTCRSMEELEVVEDNLCDEGLRPPTNQSCSPDPCPAQWAEGPWGECSQRCGIGGVRSREVTCQKIIDNDIKSVPDKECFDLLGPKPGAFQHCNEEVPCPKWFIGHWIECDRICDEGKQTRQVVCYQKKDGRIKVLDEKDCTEKKPEVEQPCMLQPCEGVDWVTSGWSGCDSCLSKNRTRVVLCSTITKKVVDDRFCHYHNRPVDYEECQKDQLPPCDVLWYATQWSQCSVKCGDGVQTREVFCGMYYSDPSGVGVKVVEDAKCANLTKYTDTKPCTVPKEECPSLWFAGPWSACTHTCGIGERFRRVVCYRGDQESYECDMYTVLISTELCNIEPCEEDDNFLIDLQTNSTVLVPDMKINCMLTKFGCCPDKKIAAIGPFDEGCPKPQTCLGSKYGCCPDGLSPAQGYNNEGCPVELCADTLFGCCSSDNKTAAQGNDQEGCPPPPPPYASSDGTM